MTRPRPLVPVLVFLGMVVAVVSSLGAPLVPTIAATTHVSLSDAQWSLTITLLVGAVTTPIMGRLGDGPRRRPVVLATLATVAIGCVLAALPLPFSVLLVGRALMGTGLGLTPLAMATARDALRGEKSRSAIALLSVTTVAGIGLGYPLTGVIADQLSLRACFWFGALVTAIAFAAAVVVFPSTRHVAHAPLDVQGALLLGTAVAGLLLAMSEVETWPTTRLVLLALMSVGLIARWLVHELRIAHPLVDLRLLRDRTVLTADVTALFAGIGMYILFSMVIRFVQTPTSTGYGFGASVVVAGLVLLPFSVMSVVASRTVPLIARRFTPNTVLPVGCAVFAASELLFVLTRGRLWEVLIVMALAGLGVGCTFAAIPGLIVHAIPASKTGSAMGFNQVLRYVGCSLGSALSATVLQIHTPIGQQLPTNGGYTVAALVGFGVLAFAGVLSAVVPARGRKRDVPRPDGRPPDHVAADLAPPDVAHAGLPVGVS